MTFEEFLAGSKDLLNKSAREMSTAELADAIYAYAEARRLAIAERRSLKKADEDRRAELTQRISEFDQQVFNFREYHKEKMRFGHVLPLETPQEPDDPFYDGTSLGRGK